MTTRRYVVLLVGVTAAGLTFRLIYALNFPITSVSGDGSWYHFGALSLAAGRGFLNPPVYVFTRFKTPGADHPPAWTVVLAVVSRLGVRSFEGHRAVACFVGAATIPTIGTVGRRLGGPRTGLAAALIAAAYPNFWMYESMLLSETLAILVVAVTILLALRFSDRPRLGRGVALGAVCGLLALVRAEQILLLGLLVVPLILMTRDYGLGQRVRWLAAALAAAIVVIAPWSIFNLERFDRPTLLTTNFGAALAISNCDQTYRGPDIGYWLNSCTFPATGRLGDQRAYLIPLEAAQHHEDASQLDAEERRVGLEYARSHLSRLPLVVLAREGRTWNVFRPFQQMQLDLIAGNIWIIRVGFFAYWSLAILAIVGALVLRAQRRKIWTLAAFVVTVAIATAITFGQTRYRAPADVSIVLLAAVAIDYLLGLRTANKHAPNDRTSKRPRARTQLARTISA
jgi:4-amino-4-deoxy-L-arabinose transferase-like glycosyltransferase